MIRIGSMALLFCVASCKQPRAISPQPAPKQGVSVSPAPTPLSSQPSVPPPSLPPAVQQQIQSGMADVMGTWSQSCGRDSFQDPTDESFDTVVFMFINLQVTTKMSIFTDSKCTNLAYQKRIVSRVVGGGVLNSNPSNSKTLDTQSTNLYIKPASQEVIDIWNGKFSKDDLYCGGGWKLNVEREMKANACISGRAQNPMPDFLRVSYDIYRVEGNKFYMGVMGKDGTATDGSTPQRRPTQFSNRFATKIL